MRAIAADAHSPSGPVREVAVDLRERRQFFPRLKDDERLFGLGNTAVHAIFRDDGLAYIMT